MNETKKRFMWATVERIAPLAIAFVCSVIIARKVGPSAYGLIGMIGIFMALAAAFSELALSASLIQKRTITEDDETSVFVVNIAAGIVLTLLLCSISPLVASFFRQRILVPLLCVQSLTIFISSFGIVQQALITRRMNFKLNAMIEAISGLLSGVVGVCMAWLGYGVWSLVGLNVSRETSRVALLWMVGNWRPCGKFCMASIHSMWGYSSKLLYSSLLHRVATNLHTVVIGRVYSPAALGVYTRASSLQSLPTGILAGVVQRVSFPQFCTHQDNIAVLLSTIRRQIRVLAVGTCSILACVAVVSEELVPLLLGHKWDGVIPLLKILCLGGVLTSLFPSHSEMVKALGKSEIFFRIELIKKGVISLVVFTVYRYGISALAWGAVVISVTDYVLSAYPNVKLIGYNWRMQGRDIFPAALLCGMDAACVMKVNWNILPTPLYAMIAKATLFTVLLAGGVITFRKVYFPETWEMIASFLRLKRQRGVEATADDV